MRVVSVLLTMTIIVGIIPVRIVKADTTTGQSATISVNYQEQSSWGDFTQAQIDVTNTSGKAIDEWIVALTFDSPVLVSSIWNAVLCETDISSENTLYITNESYNGHIEAGNTVSFGLITQSESGLPTAGAANDDGGFSGNNSLSGKPKIKNKDICVLMESKYGVTKFNIKLLELKDK